MSPLSGFAISEAALEFLATLQPKIRKQVIKKARALQSDPHPAGSKLLKDITAANGDQVYRERAGDYRILYVVRSNPCEVVVIDIDHRKCVYRNR